METGFGELGGAGWKEKTVVVVQVARPWNGGGINGEKWTESKNLHVHLLVLAKLVVVCVSQKLKIEV